MTSKPKALLIHGYLGTGKTTLAKRLEVEERALRFTHDDWIAQLYGRDPREEDFREYAGRVSGIIEGIWPRCRPSSGACEMLNFGQQLHSSVDLPIN